MQDELNTDYPELDIQILGINGVGQESGNTWVTSERDIPWLQDVNTNGSDVWSNWGIAYRDVAIVDHDNVMVGSFNLTTYNLGNPVNYNALAELFVATAQIPEPATLPMLAIGILMLGRRRVESKRHVAGEVRSIVQDRHPQV